MPGFNGTGPEGRGPLTGRGLGRCATDSEQRNVDVVKDETNPNAAPRFYGQGLGLRRGCCGRLRGRGLGFNRGFRSGNGRRGW